MTTPTSVEPDADQLPDLRAIITSDDAAEAVQEVLREYSDSPESSHVGSLTDEELVVCTGSLEGAQPSGQWYAGLGEHPQRVARATALRSLTSREEVLVTMHEDGGLSTRVSRRLMALLRLRLEIPLLSAQAMTRQGPAWYVLRRCEDLWLREVVSGQGFHSYDLLRLDDDEELFLRGFMGLLDRNTASSVKHLVQPGGGAPAPGEVVSFLTKQRHVTQLAMVHPGTEQPEAAVVAVDEQGETTLGTAHGEDVVYDGADPESVLERVRSWRAGW